jgi:hypothetical protein
MGLRQIQRSMGDQVIWEIIATAPFGRDLELAVIELGRVHALVFACRRTAEGWINAETGRRIAIDPTHWRRWLQS